MVDVLTLAWRVTLLIDALINLLWRAAGDVVIVN